MSLTYVTCRNDSFSITTILNSQDSRYLGMCNLLWSKSRTWMFQLSWPFSHEQFLRNYQSCHAVHPTYLILLEHIEFNLDQMRYINNCSMTDIVSNPDSNIIPHASSLPSRRKFRFTNVLCTSLSSWQPIAESKPLRISSNQRVIFKLSYSNGCSGILFCQWKFSGGFILGEWFQVCRCDPL